jgi:hypothetical protein
MLQMSWVTRFKMKQHLRGSLWLVPLAGGVLGSLLAVVVDHPDSTLHLPDRPTCSELRTVSA